VIKHFQYLFRLFVALVAIPTATAVWAQQEALLKIDVIRLDSRFDKLVPPNVKIEKITGGHKWVEDGSTLCITSNRTVYRLKLTTKGAGF
jgi:hypothetical protein